MSALPLVSIIIPHQAGTEVLLACLESVHRDGSYPNREILLVDNGSTDGSVQAAVERFGDVQVVALEENQGYAGGCNRGIEVARGDYVVLLNDDTELAAGWLSELVQAAEDDPSIAAAQPKIRSLRERDAFEYSGAAGGLMDLYAYPFSRGRLMGHVEKDRGQYDDPIEVFWASGVCMLIRRTALDEAGLFDEVFFAYMEEIDLCWRLQLQGYRVVYVPSAVVYHIGGYSLDQRVLKRMYLNHRNSLVMLAKNYSSRSLLRILPVKILLEIFILVGALFRNPRRSRAVVMAFSWILGNLPTVFRLRREVQERRRVTDAVLYERLYLGMAPLWYFLFGIRRVTDLPDIDRVLHRPYRDVQPVVGEVVRPEVREFLDAYLDQAPTALALQRATECRLMARFEFPRPILDLGCGDGTFARMLFNGIRVDAAVDADPVAVEQAREARCYHEVELARPEALPQPAESVATVLANGTLGGPGQPQAALQEIHRVLQPGGTLRMTAPTPDFQRFRLWSGVLDRLGAAALARGYEGFARRALGCETPVDPEVWIDRLQAAGFEVLTCEPYFSEGETRLQDAFLPFSVFSSLSRHLLGRKLALPRLHRLVVRTYRGWLRGEPWSEEEAGAGIIVSARKPASARGAK
ncbi:glycosyltransferase [Myxococcota bacterium]|nr:glycosyltransferase [Myxococcota bacterium]